VRPDGWLEDESEMIPDETSSQPDDWDFEMDGEWEAPVVENPKCKAVGCGKWTAPLVDNPKCKEGCGLWTAPSIENPNFKGKWSPRKIPNPNFYEDLEPYRMTAIDTLALELWSISNNVVFDNFLITDDKAVATSLAAQTWRIKSAAENHSASIFGGGLANYALIGIGVAVCIGLLTMVFYRNFFRRQSNIDREAERLKDAIFDAVPKKGKEEPERQPKSQQTETIVKEGTPEDETVESSQSEVSDSEAEVESSPQTVPEDAEPEVSEPVVTKRSRARRE